MILKRSFYGFKCEPPSTLIRHENEVFRKRISNRGNLKIAALRSGVDRKLFSKNGGFCLCHQDHHVASLAETQIQNDW